MSIAESQPDAKPRRRRWYRLTPDRCVVGLLGVEGVLLLSQRFHLFPKGYAVLLAAASVGLFVAAMLLWFAAAVVFRCWFQYSLRSLLLLTLAVAVVCSWMSVEVKKAKQQAAAVAAATGLHGVLVWYGNAPDPSDTPPKGQSQTAAWLWRLVGADFFAEPSCAEWVPECAPESGAKIAPRDPKNVGDIAAERLGHLPQLRAVSLSESAVTDEGLRHISRLAHLRVLELVETGVSDTGLRHLEGLKQLETLNVSGTNVTGDGVRRLQRVLPHCNITWGPARPDGVDFLAPPSP
jgi:hypothetical protein